MTERRYVDESGVGVNEAGQSLEWHASRQYRDWLAVYLRITARLVMGNRYEPPVAEVLSQLESLAAGLVDAGEREDALEDVRELRELDVVEPQDSEARKGAVIALSHSLDARGTLTEILAGVEAALTEAQPFLDRIDDRIEQVTVFSHRDAVRRRAEELRVKVAAVEAARPGAAWADRLFVDERGEAISEWGKRISIASAEFADFHRVYETLRTAPRTLDMFPGAYEELRAAYEELTDRGAREYAGEFFDRLRRIERGLREQAAEEAARSPQLERALAVLWEAERFEGSLDEYNDNLTKAFKKARRLVKTESDRDHIETDIYAMAHAAHDALLHRELESGPPASNYPPES